MKISKQRLLCRALINGGCWMWTGATTRDGYGKVADDKGGWVLVHRVAAALWLSFDLASRKKVLHTCDVPGCFNPKHLYVGTQKQNVQDAINRGRWNAPKGTRHARSRLTEESVRKIRKARAKGLTLKTLADLHGVTTSAIYAVCAGKTWKHVEENA